MSSQESPKLVDFGAHYYPELPEDVRSKHLSIEEYAGAPICTDIQAVIERYQESGLDGVVLSQPYYMGSSDTDAVTAANDELIEEIDGYDDIYGLAALPVGAGGDEAANEFERALERGYNGGAMETYSEGVDMIDPSLEPLYEVADRTGAPLLIHPNVAFQEDGSAGPSGTEDTWLLNSILGIENQLAGAIAKVVHEGLFDTYPDLNLVFHHNGGNIASMLSRFNLWIDRAHRTDGEHLKQSDDFIRQIQERAYVDTAGYFGAPRSFRATFEVFPSSQVLYATDFPYETVAPETFQKIVGMVEGLRPVSDAEAVLGGNALDLLVNVN